MARGFTEQELRTADLVWLCDLTFAGQVWHFASVAVEVDGVPYAGTLADVDYADEVDTFGTPDFALPSAGVTVQLDNVALLIASGHDLSAATASLSLWRKGSDSDDRKVVVQGRAVAAQYGGKGEALTFSIEPDWLDAVKSWPPPSHVVQASTWILSQDSSRGKAYPTIIGRPNSSPIYAVNVWIDGITQAVVGMVAGHRVKATAVTVHGSDNPTPFVLPVEYQTDQQGHQCAVVKIPASYGTEQTFFCEWHQDGGMMSPLSVNDTLTTAADVIRWALDVSCLRVDTGRLIPVLATLRDYQFDGFIGESVDVLEWLKAEVLTLLPVSLIAGDGGVYLVGWDTRDTEPVADIVAFNDVYRESLLEYQDTQIKNEITMRFDYHAATQDTRQQYTLTGDQSVKTSDTIGRNAYCIRSHVTFGPRTYEVEGGDMVSDPVTASKIVGWHSRASSSRSRVVTYSTPINLAWLNIGDVVLLTDDDVYLADQRATVQSIRWGEASLLLTLLIANDAARDHIHT